MKETMDKKLWIYATVSITIQFLRVQSGMVASVKNSYRNSLKNINYPDEHDYLWTENQCCKKEEKFLSTEDAEIYYCQESYKNISSVFYCNSWRRGSSNSPHKWQSCKVPGGEFMACEDVTNYSLGIEMRFAIMVAQRIKPLVVLTGVISIISAGLIFLGLVAYLIQWRQLNVYRWTQFSLMLALFLTFFVAGIRRLATTNAKTFWESRFPELLEDYGCAAVSTNLIVISFDLFYMIWKVLPPQHNWHSYKRFWMSIGSAWSFGSIVILLHILLPSTTKEAENGGVYDPNADRNQRLEKIMERILCIQMYSTNSYLARMLTYTILGLFSINALLFIAIGFILWKRWMEDILSREKMLREWIFRYLKLFLIIGLWWPLNITCVFECFETWGHVLSIWTSFQISSSSEETQKKLSYEIPWHIYIIQNCLAVQAIIILAILVINKKTFNDIQKLCNKDVP